MASCVACYGEKVIEVTRAGDEYRCFMPCPVCRRPSYLRGLKDAEDEVVKIRCWCGKEGCDLVSHGNYPDD